MKECNSTVDSTTYIQHVDAQGENTVMMDMVVRGSKLRMRIRVHGQ